MELKNSSRFFIAFIVKLRKLVCIRASLNLAEIQKFWASKKSFRMPTLKLNSKTNFKKTYLISIFEIQSFFKIISNIISDKTFFFKSSKSCIYNDASSHSGIH
jgi:hypothetical protein